MLSTEQQLSLILNDTCDCRYIDLHLIQKVALSCGKSDEFDSVVTRTFKKWRRPTPDPNTFECRKCGTEVKLQQPEPAPEPTPTPTPTTPNSQSNHAQSDDTEFVKAVVRSAGSAGFRFTASTGGYHRMTDFLEAVCRYDLDSKQLAVCHKIIQRGGQCTVEQISATLRRNIHREWNIDCLEYTFSELAHEPAQPIAPPVELSMSYQEAADYLAPCMRTGSCVTRTIGRLSAPRKNGKKGPLNRVGRGRICAASVRAYKVKLLREQ